MWEFVFYGIFEYYFKKNDNRQSETSEMYSSCDGTETKP